MASKAKRVPSIKPINNFAMLTVLSVFQLITGLQAVMAGDGFSAKTLLSIAILIGAEWILSLIHI